MNIPLQVNNTTPHQGFRKVEICTVPVDVVDANNTSLYWVTGGPNGDMVGWVGDKVGDHHYNLEIVGDWGPGRYDLVAMPMPEMFNLIDYRWSPHVTGEITALQPRATHNGRDIVWEPPARIERPTSQQIAWYGKTATAPMVSVTVHQRLGDMSDLCDIVAWATYSDRTSALLVAEGEFKIEFGEPISWHTHPTRGEMRTERGHVMRGTMMFTPGELADPSINAEPFYRGRVNVRCAPSVWEGKFLVFSNLRGSENWAEDGYLGQSTFPGDTGGRRAFCVAELSGVTGSPRVIEQLLWDTDIEMDRPSHYLNSDGSPFNGAAAENAQYQDFVYNSEIDYRLGAHDNFGKPKTWTQVGTSTAQDWGHITLQGLAAAYALTSDPAKYRQLADAAEMLMIGTGFGSLNDRYAGQPLSAACILWRVLENNYKTRLEAWIAAYLTTLTRWEVDSGISRNAAIWPGMVGDLYGRYVPNAPLDGAGKPVGFAPWQVARYIDGIIYAQACVPHLVSTTVYEDAQKMAEAVVSEGFREVYDAALNVYEYNSHYAVAYDGGLSINVGDLAHDRGLATGLHTANEGYLWTCASAIALCAGSSIVDPIVKRRAVRMLGTMENVCSTHSHAAWMAHIEKTA